MPIVNNTYIQATLADPPVKQLQQDLTAAMNGVTATAGGGQANAVQINNHVFRVTTVGTAADSVKLPPAQVGTDPVIVINAAAANSMNIFPNTGDAINALSANTAIACAANKTMIFICAVNGTWNSVLTA